MTKHGFLTFHIVDISPWPVFMSLGMFGLMTSMVEFFTLFYFNTLKFLIIISFCVLTFNGWTRDVSHEGAFLGSHTLCVQQGLKMGFILFILSEVMFFVSFFWSLFYLSVTPSVVMGGWPPIGVASVDPLGIPLLGSLLLMSSGISISWSHYAMLEGNKDQTLFALCLTMLLGVLFSLLQLMEYMESSFAMSDSFYGSIFFMSTGFHGLHVLIGTMFLFICFLRIKKNLLSMNHHAGFEFAIWYWHFVDVVWLFLYLCMYWWGW